MTKNKKSFITIMQIKDRKIRARVYRVKKNKHEAIGFISFKKMPRSTKERDDLVIEMLQYKGHICIGHVRGVDYCLDTV